MTHSVETREEFLRLRSSGRSLSEIARTLNISKSTASLWAKNVTISVQGQQRLNRRIIQSKIDGGRASGGKRRVTSFNNFNEGRSLGLNTEISQRNAVCIGLYWGDGARSDGRWRFSNTDRDAVSMVIEWVKDSGYNEGFVAYINAYNDSPYTRSEIESFWKEAGIDNVVVTFLESKCLDSKIGKHPFGCCHVTSKSKKRFLFGFYIGQREKARSNEPG